MWVRDSSAKCSCGGQNGRLDEANRPLAAFSRPHISFILNNFYETIGLNHTLSHISYVRQVEPPYNLENPIIRRVPLSRVAHMPTRTWNPLRRFFPLLPAWWAHIENQRILNDYVAGIIRRRWDLIQKERSAAIPTGFRNHGDGGGSGNGCNVLEERRRDILDKVLDALAPDEWGPATERQVGYLRDYGRTSIV